ncbi:carbohydrate ABC transporter permease [Azorhizobium oxalatiphilum]|nr:sugar ABC transporter permease [Azorhizobium oxalatiphilum]
MTDRTALPAAAAGNARPAKARAPARKAARRQARTAYALLAPALLLMAGLLILPLAAIFALALTDYQLGAQAIAFIGIDNFKALAVDPVFWQALGNTLLYAAMVVPGSIGLGLVAALLIESGTSLRSFYRAALFLPVMATLIAMAIVWEFMLHPTFGLVNAMLGVFGIAPHNWLLDKATALPVLAVIGIWQQFGFAMVLFLAGLVSIPRQLYEAAALDGVPGGWERFRLITWPLLGPVSLFILVISATRAFQVFDVVYALTKGGPSKSTEVMLYSIYTEGFEFFRTGYASALTIVFIVLILAVTLIKKTVLEKRVHYA